MPVVTWCCVHTTRGWTLSRKSENVTVTVNQSPSFRIRFYHYLQPQNIQWNKNGTKNDKIASRKHGD